MSGCETCRLVATRDAELAPAWDSILRTSHWDVVHASGSSLLGWLCLVVRRHITSIDEMTDAESDELGRLLRDLSAFLRADRGCVKTYVMQFAEHPDHPHVHFHLAPRSADLPPEHRGAGVFAHLGATESEHIPESELNAFAARLRAWHGQR